MPTQAGFHSLSGEGWIGTLNRRVWKCAVLAKSNVGCSGLVADVPGVSASTSPDRDASVGA